MRRKLRRTLLIAGMSLALGPWGNVQAGLILETVGLSWGDFRPPQSAGDTTVVVNDAELRWGMPHPSTPYTGLEGQSAIQAESRPLPISVKLDTSTEIVDLHYINANLSPPQSITSADLLLDLAFDQGSAQATYRITINETPDPEVGDEDGRAADTISARELKSFDFLDDFNITFQEMLSLSALEGGTADGAISIMVTAVQQILPPPGVPEPSVLWMMATGLLVLLGTPGLIHQRKRRAVSDRNP